MAPSPQAARGYPPDSVPNLRVNTLWDGLFHASTYVFTILGLAILWRRARRTHVHWSGRILTGALLVGWGLFNVIEGIVDHHLLGIHHVNETVSPALWIWWDVGFLIWGVAMLSGGWALLAARATRDGIVNLALGGRDTRRSRASVACVSVPIPFPRSQPAMTSLGWCTPV